MIAALVAAFEVANYGVERAHTKLQAQKAATGAVSNPNAEIINSVKKIQQDISKAVEDANDPEKIKVFVDTLNQIRDTVAITAQTAGNALKSSEQTKALLVGALSKGASNGSNTEVSGQ